MTFAVTLTKTKVCNDDMLMANAIQRISYQVIITHRYKNITLGRQKIYPTEDVYTILNFQLYYQFPYCRLHWNIH